MKKIQIGFILILLMAILAGCSAGPSLSAEQNDQAAEYVAGALLKYDKNYEEALIYDTEEKKEETAEETAEPKPSAVPSPSAAPGSETGTPMPEEEDNKLYTLDEVFGLADFKIKYKSYKLRSSYPDNPMESYFSMDAKKGHKYVMAEFEIKNVSNTAKTINLLKENITYQLNVNETVIYEKPSLTLLENDLQYVNMEIEKNATKKAMLVFQIKDQPDVKSMNMLVAKDDKASIVKMK